MNVADTIMMLEAAVNEIKRLQLDPATVVSSFHLTPKSEATPPLDTPVKAIAIQQQNGAIILGIKY